MLKLHKAFARRGSFNVDTPEEFNNLPISESERRDQLVVSASKGMFNTWDQLVKYAAKVYFGAA